MALATLSIDLVAKLAELQAGMDKAGRLVEKSVADMEARFASLKTAAAGVGAALAGALAVDALGARFKAVVDGLDKLNDLADATGSTVENLSALEDIAARTGTRMDVVGDAVVKLNKALADAKPDSDQARALAAIGLTAEELKRLDPAEALVRVAKALAGFADDGNKARLTQELFGKSLREVAPLLKDLAENGALVAKVTGEQARQAEDFNKQLFQLQKNSEDTARSIVGSLLPALNRLFEARKTGGLTGVINEIGEMVGLGQEYYAKRTLTILADDLQLLQLRVATQGPGAGLTALKAELAAKQAEYDAARAGYIQVRKLTAEDQGNYSNEGRPRARRSVGELPPKVVGLAAIKEPKLAPLDDATKAALKAIEDADIGKADNLRAALAKLQEIFADTPDNPAFLSAAQKISAELEKLEPAARAAAEAKKQLDALLTETPTGQIEAVRAEIDLITAALERADSQAERNKLGEAFGQAYDKLSKLSGRLEGTAQEINTFAEQAARNIQDTLGDSVQSLLEGNFSNIGKAWGSLLQRMAAQALAAQLGRALLGDSFAKTGEVGGIAKTAFDFIAGLGTRATGGPVTAGTPYLVGERGAEIVVPQRNATVLPNGVGLGGSSMVYAPNINFNGPIPEEQKAWVRQMIAAEQAKFGRQMRLAGAI